MTLKVVNMRINITFKTSLLILTLSFATLITPVFANIEAIKLNQVINKISALKTDISQTQKQQVNISQQLRDTEIDISKIATSYKRTEQNIKEQLSTLNKLNINKIANEQQLRNEETLLINQIRSIYMMGQASSLKMLLNQEDPTKFNRMQIYHRYLVSSRLQFIAKINNTLKLLKQNKIKTEEHTRVLKNLEAQQKTERTKFEQLKQKHIQILKKVKNKIQTQNEKLQTLIANKENLEKIIASLKAAKKLHHKIPQSAAQMCAKLIWPTPGKITTHFGSSIEQSQWKWNGTIISAPEGQDIRSIDKGSVVYADWLAGYGLLLILDHNNGYISLYGHNHSIYKKLNDNVDAGEVIATVGKSGGSEHPELYFAVRYNGKSVNPEICYKK
jgi:murein hydrolase activator